MLYSRESLPMLAPTLAQASGSVSNVSQTAKPHIDKAFEIWVVTALALACTVLSVMDLLMLMTL